MSEHLLLAPLLESYFRRRLTKQRNATSATLASYRDALRMLILFAAAPLRKKPATLSLEDLDRDLVLAFLDELEEKRNNSVATRNARLAAIRSFFHHVAATDPASFGVAQRVLTIPTKRAHIEVTHHLTIAEVEAIIAAPDQTTPRGRRDRAFLLFLARTGARVSEATGVNANDLQLERGPPQVLLHGKGRRDRVVPIPKDLVRSLTDLLSERGLANHEPRPIFVGVHNERLTRFGATHIVRRAASQAASTRPSLEGKPISPHIFRHSLAISPVRRGPPDDPGLAWPCSGRHNPPVRRCGCRDDAPRTREGGRLRRPQRALPAERHHPAAAGQHLIMAEESSRGRPLAGIRAPPPHNLARHIRTDRPSWPRAPVLPILRRPCGSRPA